METQIACFTCGYRIGPTIEKVKKYEEKLFLTPQDAIDKAQIKQECCRMTIMAQSGVEERVRAAGRPVTGPNGIMTVEIPEGIQYPEISYERTPKPKPQTGADLAKNTGKASWTFFSAGKTGLTLKREVAKSRGETTFFQDRAKPPHAESMPQTFFSIFIEGWDLTNRDSYPKPEWGNVEVLPNRAIFIPVAPFSDFMVKFVPDKNSTVRDLITKLANFVTSPNKTVQAVLLKKTPAIKEYPDLIEELLMKASNEDHISLSEVYGGKMDILRKSKGPEPNSIILEFDNMKNPPHYSIPKYTKFISRLENYLKNLVIRDASNTIEGGIVLKLYENDNEDDEKAIELTIKGVDIMAESDETTEGLTGSIVKSVVHSRNNERSFYIVLSEGEKYILLKIEGMIEGIKDRKTLDIVYPF